MDTLGHSSKTYRNLHGKLDRETLLLNTIRPVEVVRKVSFRDLTLNSHEQCLLTINEYSGRNHGPVTLSEK